ncbi:MAG: hypothetical protein ACETWM_20105 [Candidatus Lokiarchaeia archaeon]
MVRNFYLFRSSGECVISRDYGDPEIDENLVSGFLSAMFSFGSNISSGRNIESVLLKDKKFVFLVNNNLIFGAYGDRDESIKDKLEIISDEFIETYGNLVNWSGDRDQFVDFFPKLDEIFGGLGKETPDTLLNDFIQKIQAGKSFDIKGSLDEWIKSLKERARKAEM